MLRYKEGIRLTPLWLVVFLAITSYVVPCLVLPTASSEPHMSEDMQVIILELGESSFTGTLDPDQSVLLVIPLVMEEIFMGPWEQVKKKHMDTGFA